MPAPLAAWRTGALARRGCTAQRREARLDARAQRRAHGLGVRPALKAVLQAEGQPDEQVGHAVRGLQRLHLAGAHAALPRAPGSRLQRVQQRRAHHPPGPRSPGSGLVHSQGVA